MPSPRILGPAVLVLLSTRALAEPAPDVTGGAGGDPDDDVAALPCRPTIACTAEIVRGGALEVELGYAGRRGPGSSAHSMVALAKYSVTDRLQLQLGSNNVVMSSGDGARWLDGVYLGPKLVLVPQTARVPTIAVSALVMLPTRSGDAAVTQTTDAYLWAYASKDMLGFHADLNLGVDVLSVTDQPATQIVTALSVSHDLAYHLGAMLETYAFEGGGRHAAHDAGVLFGLSYAPVPRIMFDLGGDIALHRDARTTTLFAGVTFVPYRSTPPRRAARPALASAPR